MANEEHVDRLKSQSREEWNRWVQHYAGIIDIRNADLSDTDLKGVILNRALLSGAKFSGADLKHAILHGANLRDADLSGAVLEDALLTASNFRGAILHSTILTYSDLSDTTLSGADLTYAKLFFANLTRATVDGATLDRAEMANTTIGDVDLSQANGLESVKHLGPSTIGIDTIFKSKGKIPEAFLRGAGVPENLITYIPSLVGNAIEFYSCFISYSHADVAFARRLHDTLQGRGIRCWLDERQLLPGHNIYDEIDRGIKLWDKVLLCCSKASLSSWWVDNEVDKAFTKEQSLWKERGEKVLSLIPLNLDGALFDWQDGKANAVRQRLAADFTSWESSNTKFEHGVESLVKALRAHDGGREKPPKPLL